MSRDTSARWVVSYAQSASGLCPGSSARNNSQQSGEIPSLHLHGVGSAPKQQADVWKLHPVGPELLPRRIQTSKPRKVRPGIDQLVMTVSAAVLGHWLASTDSQYCRALHWLAGNDSQYCSVRTLTSKQYCRALHWLAGNDSQYCRNSPASPGD